MIIFESTLTTFEVSFIFWDNWGNIKNWLELKIEPPLADLALLNPWNTLYERQDKKNSNLEAFDEERRFGLSIFSELVLVKIS